jgi:hypothetical protein
MLHVLDPDHSSEQDILFAISVAWRYDPGTIDQVDTFHQGDVLPHFGLAWNWCNGTHPLLTQRVDDRRFSSVGIADKADRDLLPGRMKDGELAQEGDERAFAERICERGVKC